MTPTCGAEGSIFVRGLRSLRDEGPRVFLLKTLSMLGYRRLYLLRRSLAEPIERPPTGVPLRIDWLSAGDPEALEAYAAMRPAHATARADALRRLRTGDRCLVARRDGRLVGAMWASRGRSTIHAESLGREVPLEPGEAYVFDAYTPPEFRDLGIASALSVAWLLCLRDEGCTAAVRLTHPENAAALRSHAKAGYRRSALLRCLRIGPWRFDFAPRAVAAAGADGASCGEGVGGGNENA